MIYLASPYSHPDPAVRHARYEQTRDFTANAIRRGHMLFSPIVYAHDMAVVHGLPTDAESWGAFNYEMLIMASCMWVLKLPGWEESLGIQGEIDLMKNWDYSIRYVEPL